MTEDILVRANAILEDPDPTCGWTGTMIDLIAEVERLRSENKALNEKLIEAKAKEIYPFNMPHWDNLPEEDTVDKLCPIVTRRGKAYWRKEATRQLAEEMKHGVMLEEGKRDA